ncbi:MAG: hypothetical protein LW870_25160 [Pirellula sp.]|jgi:hypothetical protein|nr:hypothetical protein [Pirellula sp.]
MKSLNKKSAAIFSKCIADLLEPGESRRIGDASNGFMPLCVECIARWQEKGRIYSLAHYSEQNSDLMADPEMCFYVGPQGDVFAISYRNDFVVVNQVAAEPIEESSWRFNAKLQKELCAFAQDWLRNIEEQQEL